MSTRIIILLGFLQLLNYLGFELLRRNLQDGDYAIRLFAAIKLLNYYLNVIYKCYYPNTIYWCQLLDLILLEYLVNDRYIHLLSVKFFYKQAY